MILQMMPSAVPNNFAGRISIPFDIYSEVGYVSSTAKA